MIGEAAIERTETIGNETPGEGTGIVADMREGATPAKAETIVETVTAEGTGLTEMTETTGEADGIVIAGVTGDTRGEGALAPALEEDDISGLKRKPFSIQIFIREC